ncbi:MAG: hypothetical protein IJF13_00940, partial [Clostridia bacterium]|nr:hypothetical protein [Clostridia bacterium]
SIKVESVLGLNEQIYLNLAKGEYVISNKKEDAEEYTVLDKDLMLENGEMLDCYILGLAKGLYDVKIEQGEGDNYACKTLTDIDVEKQDRSGYAHFQRDEGIGGYNNDGTVKEGARIVYLTNENKNTVTLDVNGTTYTGIVEILEAKEHIEEPLIIRVLDKVATNQFKGNVAPPDDYSNLTDEYFKSLFANNMGENIAGIPVTYRIKPLNKQVEYVTTPDGIEFVKEIEGEVSYDFLGWTGVITMENASNLTIEGVGTEAEFYQLTFYFGQCNSIEIKNLTFSKYPANALDFQSGGKTREECTSDGWYWIHNNTFNSGKNYWEEGIEKSVCLSNMRNATISYNKFFGQDKVVLLGGWEYDYQMNVTLHHNFYLNCGQRTPLSRNANIHSYNNYIASCDRGPSPRTSTYLFSEANYFEDVETAYYTSGTEILGAIKSWGDKYKGCGATESITKVAARDETVENDCSPDGITDYSKFDTDPELFYYDAENKRSDVEILHEAKDVPDFVFKYAGAGILERMDFPTDAE